MLQKQFNNFKCIFSYLILDDGTFSFLQLLHALVVENSDPQLVFHAPLAPVPRRMFQEHGMWNIVNHGKFVYAILFREVKFPVLTLYGIGTSAV